MELAHPKSASTSPRWLLPVTLAITFVMLLFVAYWGGATRIDALFFLGIAVMSTILVAFGALTWWLYLSPLPAAAVAPRATLKPVVRQAVALLAVISGLLFITGGVWDETWHKLYGVGGPVNDFFWPPHKMLYGSMALAAFFAGAGLLLLLRGPGDLRAKFRSDPLVGMLALSSAYLVVSAPSDQLWHIIYGLDITGWSIPHISITIAAGLVMLSTAGLLLSQAPVHPWRGLGGLTFFEALAFLMLGAAIIPISQAAFVEWDNITLIGDPRRSPAFWARPEWLFPVVVISVAMFFALFALHVTRRIGAATITLLIALALRAALLTLASIWNPNGALNLNAFLLMLIPAVALDLWYWLRRDRIDDTITLFGGNLLAALVYLAVGLPRIAATMLYPRVNTATLPGMIVGSILLALWFGWAGARFGGWMSVLTARAESRPALNPRVLWLGAAVLLVLVIASVTYMLTAAPPGA